MNNETNTTATVADVHLNAVAADSDSSDSSWTMIDEEETVPATATPPTVTPPTVPATVPIASGSCNRRVSDSGFGMVQGNEVIASLRPLMRDRFITIGTHVMSEDSTESDGDVDGSDDDDESDGVFVEMDSVDSLGAVEETTSDDDDEDEEVDDNEDDYDEDEDDDDSDDDDKDEDEDDDDDDEDDDEDDDDDDEHDDEEHTEDDDVVEERKYENEEGEADGPADPLYAHRVDGMGLGWEHDRERHSINSNSWNVVQLQPESEEYIGEPEDEIEIEWVPIPDYSDLVESVDVSTQFDDDEHYLHLFPEATTMPIKSSINSTAPVTTNSDEVIVANSIKFATPIESSATTTSPATINSVEAIGPNFVELAAPIESTNSSLPPTINSNETMAQSFVELAAPIKASINSSSPPTINSDEAIELAVKPQTAELVDPNADPIRVSSASATAPLSITDTSSIRDVNERSMSDNYIGDRQSTLIKRCSIVRQQQTDEIRISRLEHEAVAEEQSPEHRCRTNISVWQVISWCFGTFAFWCAASVFIMVFWRFNGFGANRAEFFGLKLQMNNMNHDARVLSDKLFDLRKTLNGYAEEISALQMRHVDMVKDPELSSAEARMSEDKLLPFFEELELQSKEARQNLGDLQRRMKKAIKSQKKLKKIHNLN